MSCVVLGTAPLNEVANFSVRDDAQARTAAGVFARQLVRQIGAPPTGASFTVELVREGARAAYCVVCNYDEANDTALEYAWRCEDLAPLEWDAIARAELGLGDRP